MATVNGTKRGMKSNMLGSKSGALIRLIGGAIALAVTAATLPAHAAPGVGQTVSVINFNFINSTPQLAVKLSDNAVYIANVVAGNECGTVPSPPMETVKMWQSLLQSALLSGKKVNILFTDCGGFHWINEVDLTQ